MGTGKCGKYQISGIRCTLVNPHTGKALVFLADLADIGKIKLRIDTVAHHIHRQRHNINVSGALSVSEKSALHAVRTGKDTELRIADAASSVIVRVNAQHHIIPVFQMLVNILDLAGKYMRHRNLYRGRNVDDRLVLCIRLPDIEHCIADLHRIVHLCAREAFRTVLKRKIAVRLRRECL